jgi:hypothetical protein
MAGISFHIAIAIVHGLISFGLAMSAALIMYLRSPEEQFAFDWASRDEHRRNAAVDATLVVDRGPGEAMTPAIAG